MKKSFVYLFFVIIVVFFGSCQKDDQLIDVSEINVIATDNPPAELQNADGDDAQYSVYFTIRDFEEMDLSSPIRITNWYQDENGNQFTKTEIRHKIRGRTYFGFYHGNLYIAKSYTDFSVNLDVLSRITKDIKKYDYALGRRYSDPSTKYGLSIYDVFHE